MSNYEETYDAVWSLARREVPRWEGLSIFQGNDMGD